MPCLNVVFLFPVCFCFSPVGSGVDVSNESDVKINNTDDQYLSINEQVKKKNPGFLFYWVMNKQGKQPPSEPMVSKYFKTYYFATYDSTVFYQ
jgi:hypothetical protein